MSVFFEFVKKEETSKLPLRATESSAGLDIFLPHDTLLYKDQTTKIKTNLIIELPPNTTGLITGRSSISSLGLNVITGIIDNDYRGEIGVIIHNFSQSDRVLVQGERFAQLLIIPTILCEVKEKQNIQSIESRKGGFGSTGQF